MPDNKEKCDEQDIFPKLSPIAYCLPDTVGARYTSKSTATNSGMFDFNSLFEFSRTNCVAICAFLVPINLLLTTRTIFFTALQRPQSQVQRSAIFACIPAVVMILHVYTWLMIGVVMAPTFILLGLASTCLATNFWAIIYPQSIVRLLKAVFTMLPFEVSIQHYK